VEPLSNSEQDPVDLWTINGVDGQVTFVAHGEVFMLHTGFRDQPVNLDDLLARHILGLPVELTRIQAMSLIRVMLNELGQPENPENT
jgi:hypothetical protein